MSPSMRLCSRERGLRAAGTGREGGGRTGSSSRSSAEIAVGAICHTERCVVRRVARLVQPAACEMRAGVNVSASSSLCCGVLVVCMWVSLAVSLSLCLFVSVSLSLSLCLSLSLFVSVSLSLCLSVSLFLARSLSLARSLVTRVFLNWRHNAAQRGATVAPRKDNMAATAERLRLYAL